MSEYTYSRTDVICQLLAKEVEVLLPGKMFILRINEAAVFDFQDELTGEEVSSLNGCVTTHKANYSEDELNKNKALRSLDIDQKTNRLINIGFTHDEKKFSLSIPAQINWNALKNNTGDFTWPVIVSTNEDGEFSLPEADVSAFWNKGKNHIKGYLDSGRTLKLQCKAAVTQAELDAIHDDRS